MSDEIEEGYRILAKDPEMSARRRLNFGHRCGFDFELDKMTAVCKCGAVATNPLWTVNGVRRS